MNHDEKKKVIKKHARHESDTGSPEVQIGVMTARINHLTEHLKTHGKDAHSKKGLLNLVHGRRKHLQYLKMKNKDEYDKIVEKLNLRK